MDKPSDPLSIADARAGEDVGVSNLKGLISLKEGKITLPLIRTFKHCTPDEKKRIEQAVQDGNKDSIEEIKRLIDRYKGIEYSLEKAGSLVEEGKSFLDIFEDSTPREALCAIADYVIKREV